MHFKGDLVAMDTSVSRKRERENEGGESVLISPQERLIKQAAQHRQSEELHTPIFSKYQRHSAEEYILKACISRQVHVSAPFLTNRSTYHTAY